MNNNQDFKQESALDWLCKIPSIPREVYGYDKDNKPNIHCNWEQVTFYYPTFAWVEDDKHYRARLNNINKNR